jgi:hypothetical protein
VSTFDEQDAIALEAEMASKKVDRWEENAPETGICQSAFTCVE